MHKPASAGFYIHLKDIYISLCLFLGYDQHPVWFCGNKALCQFHRPCRSWADPDRCAQWRLVAIHTGYLLAILLRRTQILPIARR